MRINDGNMNGVGASGLSRAQGAEQPEKTGVQQAGGRESGATPDRVDLSGLAARVNAWEAASPARQAQLDRLAALVQAGRYEPDLEAVAGAMIDDAVEARGPE